jgi:predicted KAP-like P-loop ATPase
MWHDRRADVDLVGFERYADAIAELVLDSRLLPLTVGVYGEWGSGKSTVMHLTEKRLAQVPSEDSAVVCVPFNAWMFQGYDDTKAALMTKIIETLKKERGCVSKTIDKAEGLLQKVDWFRLTAMTLKYVILPAATSYATGMPPALVAPNTEEITSIRSTGDDTDSSAIETMEDFREEFEGLIKEAKVRALVVFVDDLDGACLQSSSIYWKR